MTVPRRLALLVAALSCAAVAGVPAATADRRLDIVGGSPAPAGAWPSIAYLRAGYHDGKGREQAFACTGSVVAPSWIVTAAHCTFGRGSRSPERMVATLGVTDSNDPGGERIAVDRFVPDPDYDTDSLVGDVGLVHLARPTSRPPIPLATAKGANAGNYASPAGVPNAAGWGAVDQNGKQLPSRLQQAYLKVRTPSDCKSLVSGFDSGTQTCAGASGGTSACLGDSGGPLVEFDAAKPALWGITSYGPEPSDSSTPCSLDEPTVYTWVPAYESFIQSTIASSPAGEGAPPARAGTRTALRHQHSVRRRRHGTS